MNTNFPRTISLLRRERKLSQRTVASKLGVSQAVLSHYENGLREPGLEFVAKAADFYRVSTDFLLGRTMSREDYTITAEDLPDSSEDKDNVLKGSMLATLNKKLIVNSISVLFDIIGKSKNKKLISEAAMYLDVCVYKLFRELQEARGNSEGFFSVDEKLWAELSSAELLITEMNIRREAQGMGGETQLPELTQEYLNKEYPALVQSLLSVLQAAGKRVSERSKSSEK